MTQPRLVKVQIAAEFVIEDPDDGILNPGTFGPIELTAKDWADFNLQERIEKELENEPN
jgi:hypothetical protein